MKIGPIDGKVEEVRDLLENHGLRLGDYLEKPLAPLKTMFLAIPAIILTIALLILAIFAGNCPQNVLTIIYLLGFGGGTWLTVSTQLKYKNTLATFVVAIGSVIMILVSSGIFTPKEAAEFIRKIK
jgi:hypothetical protein